MEEFFWEDYPVRSIDRCNCGRKEMVLKMREKNYYFNDHQESDLDHSRKLVINNLGDRKTGWNEIEMSFASGMIAELTNIQHLFTGIRSAFLRTALYTPFAQRRWIYRYRSCRPFEWDSPKDILNCPKQGQTVPPFAHRRSVWKGRRVVGNQINLRQTGFASMDEDDSTAAGRKIR